MGGAEGIVWAFGTAREAGNAVLLTQRAHAVAAAGQDFMRIRLMTDIPDDTIFRRIEYVVQRDGQFDRAQIGRQMTAGLGNGFEHEIAQLVGQRN